MSSVAPVEAAIDPHKLTVSKLMSLLSAHNVTLPTTKQKKEVYVKLVEKLSIQNGRRLVRSESGVDLSEAALGSERDEEDDDSTPDIEVVDSGNMTSLWNVFGAGPSITSVKPKVGLDVDECDALPSLSPLPPRRNSNSGFGPLGVSTSRPYMLFPNRMQGSDDDRVPISPMSPIVPSLAKNFPPSLDFGRDSRGAPESPTVSKRSFTDSAAHEEPEFSDEPVREQELFAEFEGSSEPSLDFALLETTRTPTTLAPVLIPNTRGGTFAVILDNIQKSTLLWCIVMVIFAAVPTLGLLFVLNPEKTSEQIAGILWGAAAFSLKFFADVGAASGRGAWDFWESWAAGMAQLGDLSSECFSYLADFGGETADSILILGSQFWGRVLPAGHHVLDLLFIVGVDLVRALFIGWNFIVEASGTIWTSTSSAMNTYIESLPPALDLLPHLATSTAAGLQSLSVLFIQTGAFVISRLIFVIAMIYPYLKLVLVGVLFLPPWWIFKRLRKRNHIVGILGKEGRRRIRGIVHGKKGGTGAFVSDLELTRILESLLPTAKYLESKEYSTDNVIDMSGVVFVMYLNEEKGFLISDEEMRGMVWDRVWKVLRKGIERDASC